MNAKLKCSPADTKNSGTNNPPATLRIPGIMSTFSWCGSPDRAAPKSSAPIVLWRPIRSASITIRNSPPNSNPKDSCGTLKYFCKNTIRWGATFRARTHVKMVNPAIWPSRMATLAAVLVAISPCCSRQ